MTIHEFKLMMHPSHNQKKNVFSFFFFVSCSCFFSFHFGQMTNDSLSLGFFYKHHASWWSSVFSSLLLSSLLLSSLLFSSLLLWFSVVVVVVGCDSSTLFWVWVWVCVWWCCSGLWAYLLLMRIRRPYFHNMNGLIINLKKRMNTMKTKKWMGTYEGHPNIIAKHARTVHPFPYPSLLNMAGANSGNPKPANDRKHETAASAIKVKRIRNEVTENIDFVPEAACNVKASIT